MQTPGGISIFYDVGQGQGWQRNIVMDGSRHLPANVRQWYGDSPGHWEGNTLVIDVTNFSPYEVTIEGPTVWTRPWTVKQEFTEQSDQENRIYYKPRCLEGNYALPGWLRGHRLEELAFVQGRGPDPATKDGSEAYTG